jgi:hypothetical protein
MTGAVNIMTAPTQRRRDSQLALVRIDVQRLVPGLGILDVVERLRERLGLLRRFILYFRLPVVIVFVHLFLRGDRTTNV